MPKGTGRRFHWTPEQKAEMQRLYERDEWSIGDIADHFLTSRRTIQYHLGRSGVLFRGVGMQTARARAKYSGPKHHGWKGGRNTRKDGYVLLLMPSHPRADREGYYPEHRAVMEAHLSETRPDHPGLNENGIIRHGWCVHHKDESKSNNDIGNLDLMTNGDHSRLHNASGHWARAAKGYIAYLEDLLTTNRIPFEKL